jgi:MoaA/NifB/PqqE/SkfB family radical SAM enzyme
MYLSSAGERESSLKNGRRADSECAIPGLLGSPEPIESPLHEQWIRRMSNGNGKHFCILPFVHLHLETTGVLTPCCINREKMAHIRDGSLAELWNSEKFVQMRAAMLADTYIPGCEACYSQERGKGESLRTRFNERYEKYLPAATDTVGQPVYFDLRFSNICNLKCRTCEHRSSSLWYEDAKALGLRTANQAVINATDDPEALMAQLREFIPNAVEFYFAGGEPLVMDEHYRILDMLIEAGRTDVRLGYNSNFMKTQFKGTSVFEYWRQFADVQLSVSLDAIDEAAAYVRKGTRFSSIIANRKLLAEQTPHVRVACTPTVSLMNIGSLPALLKFLLDTEFCPPDMILFNILEHPHHFNIKAAPKHVKAIISDDLTRFAAEVAEHPALVAQINQVIAYMESGDLSSQLRRFRKATLVLDAIRDEDYRNTFAKNDPMRLILDDMPK